MTEEKNLHAGAVNEQPDVPETQAGAAGAEQTEAAQPKQETEAQKPDKAQKETRKAAELEAFKTKAEKLEKQLSAAKDSLLRTAAEYDNFRKRSAREHDAAFNDGVGFAANALLPVVDTLTMAATSACADENYKKGVMMTLDQCKAALEKLGVKEMEAEGKPFDPQLHEAVMQQPAPEGVESGAVLQVLKTGYLLGEKVLRHATVIVAE